MDPHRARAPFAILAATLSSACADCPSSGRRDLAIGTGDKSHVPLTEDAEPMELVHGPQGGWHVLVSFAATGLDGAAGITTADVRGVVEGETLATVDGQWLALTCEPESGTWQAWNIFLIFDVTDPGPLHLAPLDIDATLTDARGRSATGVLSTSIFDPLAQESP